MAQSEHVEAMDPNRPGPSFEVEVKALEGQLKEGHVRQFTVMCDESARIGGTDTAPSPLGYFTLGIAF
jgi:hypothetical protein